MSEKDDILPKQCPNCKNNFTDQYQPYKLNNCIHTICEKCLNKSDACPIPSCEQPVDKSQCDKNYVCFVDIKGVSISVKCKKPNHTNNYQNYRCPKCNKVGCARCMAEEHLDHISESQIQILSDLNARHLEDLNRIKERKLEEQETTLNMLLTKIDSNEANRKKAENKYNQKELDLEQQNEKTALILEDMKNQGMSNMGNEYDKEEKKIEAMKVELFEQIQKLQEHENELNNVLREFDSKNLVKQYHLNDKGKLMAFVSEIDALPADYRVPTLKIEMRIENLEDLMSNLLPGSNL